MFQLKALAVAAIVLLPASTAMAQGKAAKAVLRACKPDIARFCSQVPPGGGRVKACMKENVHQLSEPCKEAMFQAWLHQ